MSRALPLLLLLGAAGCASSPPVTVGARASRLEIVGRALPPDLSSGSAGALEPFRGRPVLVVFFATWSARAGTLLPRLQALATERSLPVVGVALDEDSRFVAPFVERHALTFPILLDPGGRELEDVLPLRILPTLVLLDAQGHIVEIDEAQRTNALNRIVRRLQRLEGASGDG